MQKLPLKAPLKTTNLMQLLSLSSLSLATLFSANVYAAIPVESRPLSSPTTLAARTDYDQTSQLWQLTQQVQKLQDEVRQLRGKVESHDNDIDQLQKETKNRYVDFDQRLGQVQEDLKKSQNGTTLPVSTDSVNTANTNTTSNTASTTTANTTNSTTNNATAPVAGDESDKLAYIAAYEAYKAGGAAQAIAPMKKFIADYPKSQFVPNAYYWLGEFNLAITPPNFAAASSNFKLVMNQYPKTAKAAAATYRVATLADVDHHQTTAITLMQSLVKNYPGTQEAGYAADYLKSHATTTAVDKKTVEKKTETKKTETTKVETSKVEKPVVKKVDSHKTEIIDKPKTKSIKKVKATDNVREDI